MATSQSSSISTSNKDATLSKYQKMTDKEHILKKPDTYIGSIHPTDYIDYVCIDSPEGETTISQKNITVIPALYKLFDEGIVNCRDHVVRQTQAVSDEKINALPVTYIEVDIDTTDGTITMTNDGNGIDVAEHPEYKLWIPEMIFGHLRTSTNYDENKKEKIVGGKNGFGFKLVLIWSSWGRIETVDHVRQLKYIQEFKNNLNEICPPKITKCTTKPYTKISFRPDYTRFGITNLSNDMQCLLKKRVYDIAAVTDKSIRVKFNGQTIPVKHFQQYIDMYIGSKGETKRIYEMSDPRWEYAICLTPHDEFRQISFVNGIYTQKGGKHVEYIMGQILRKLCALIKKKKKVDVKPNTIKEQLMLFLRCDIENPSFSSQTKDELGTPVSSFGSSCTVSDEFIEKIAKMGVMDAACALTEVKENKAAKKTDGTKTRTIRGIPKLIDANFAGTDKSSQCTIIFCEGDSAKAGIVSGLSKEDRNFIGVYPMKGKILNTRGEAIKKISENNEITEIKQILGLETGKKYTKEDVAKKLRYGKVLFMTDQDLDGSHIKGLGINLFQSEWNTLSQIPGFIGFMNTPILKAKKGCHELTFYNEGEYEEWKKQTEESGQNPSTWHIKYYKGLGTSTGKEFKEYFQQKKIVDFNYTGEISDDAIDMVFNKKRADDRKEWLSTFSRDRFLDTSKKHISYEEFINNEMIHFSKYDCDRSIPNLMDGQKISLRKILYAAFKKGLKTEIKVAQFSGYVSEHSGYHHGEASLNAAIVGMAQDFVGSNNINMLVPNGQFGTRIQGGRDAASERYIFTQLHKITRLIYRPEDDAILKYLNDDGLSVEPIYYVPIIPMILVNGSKGIGTGFSTDIMCYNPLQIINSIKLRLHGTHILNSQISPIEPYYRGFQGKIESVSPTKYLIKGCYTIIANDKIRITELPVGTWTDDYKQYLETLMEPTTKEKKSTDASGVSVSTQTAPIVKEYNDMSTDVTVDITITMAKNIIEEYQKITTEHGCNQLEKVLKLYTTQSNTNMHLFDSNEKLKKYSNVYEIIDDYYGVRLEHYAKRKTHMLNQIQKELLLLSNRARYIQEILNDTLELRRKSSKIVFEILKTRNYDIIDNDDEYKYLLKMPMDSVSEENIQKLMNEKEIKEKQYSDLSLKTSENLWLDDLNELEEEYMKSFNHNKYSNDEKSKTSNGKSSVSSSASASATTTKRKPKPLSPLVTVIDE